MSEPPGIGNHTRFWSTRLFRPFGYMLQNTYLCWFPIYWLSAYLLKVISETSRANYNRYLRCYY
jgi:hypothetical protein